MIWLLSAWVVITTATALWSCWRVRAYTRSLKRQLEPQPVSPPDSEQQMLIGRNDDTARAVGLLLTRLGNRAEFTRNEIEKLRDTDQICWVHNGISDTVTIAYQPTGR